MNYILVTIIIILFISVSTEIDSIKKFDQVIYDKPIVHNSKELKISFNAFNKNFNLLLKPASNSQFKENYIEVDSFKIPIELDTYEGVLNDEPNSKVHGSFIDGLFYGTIQSSFGNFIIEAKKDEKATIIYDQNEINADEVASRSRIASLDDEGCGNDKNRDWMESIQKLYQRDENKMNAADLSTSSLNSFSNGKNTCSMYFKVDSTLYSDIFQNEGFSNPNTTIRVILSYLQRNINYLNSRFQNQITTPDGQSVNFVAYRVKIITDCSSGTLSTADKNICSSSYISVGDYLKAFATDLDMHSYCLGFGFTARDFADGSLGVAWRAKAGSFGGGVCDHLNYTSENVVRALNTAILTRKSYGTRLPEITSLITFVHEIGHNFGSEHDTSASNCAPGNSNGGNFIMFATSVSGNKPNNQKFSSCSVSQIINVINNLNQTDPSKFCFVSQSSSSFCGNGIVEPGEECDCGFDDDCKDICCYSASNTTNGCKLKPNARCSPTQGTCCTNECLFLSSSTICSPSSTCLLDVYCTGISAVCPTTDSKYFVPLDTDNTPRACNEATQICQNGTCIGTICEKFGMTQCYPSGNLNNANDALKLCHVHCQGGTENRPCTDTYLLQEFKSIGGINQMSGTVCGSSSEGYCDVFYRCRVYTSDTEFDSITRLLFSTSVQEDVLTLAQQYWWVVFLGVLGVFLLSGGIMAISKFVPSSNPHKIKTKPKILPNLPMYDLNGDG